MADKPGLLLIGGATPRMMDRFTADFTIHKLADGPDLAAMGDSILAVATNGHDGVPSDVLAALPNLKIISCYGVGYDAIDTSVLVDRGILLSHTPNVLNEEVADTAIMLMLATYRNLITDDAYVRAGRWAKEGNVPLSRSGSGRTVGILGMGRIGQRIAEKLAAFNATVLYHARSDKGMADMRYCPDLTQMAKDADVLICITPGGAATRHLVNAEVLDALGPEGMLINVSRGSVVDEVALVKALQDGKLGWAGLDVFDAEPHVPQELMSMPNVVLLPHPPSSQIGIVAPRHRLLWGALSPQTWQIVHFVQFMPESWQMS